MGRVGGEEAAEDGEAGRSYAGHTGRGPLGPARAAAAGAAAAAAPPARVDMGMTPVDLVACSFLFTNRQDYSKTN